MADTEARIGHGTTFEMADIATPTDFVYIAEITNVTPPSDTSDTPDATHMQSPNRTREFIDGLADPGEASLEMNLVPGSVSDRYLMASKGKRKWCRITFPNGVQLLFTGIRQGYEKEVPLDDKMTATLTIKVSGDPILTEVAAPRNIVVPAVVGIAKVGAPLTLDPGIWAGALELEYQWQADGADVANATGSSFIPKTANVGDVITCVVTGINEDFDTEATTVATTAVVA